MAFWFADDGYSRKNGKELIFCSESFTKEENLFLIDRLKIDLNISSGLTLRSGGTRFGIRINSADYFLFMNGITPYLIQLNCLQYKIDVSKATKNTVTRYSKEEKEMAIKMTESGQSLIDVSAKIGCCTKTIKGWLNAKAVI